MRMKGLFDNRLLISLIKCPSAHTISVAYCTCLPICMTSLRRIGKSPVLLLGEQDLAFGSRELVALSAHSRTPFLMAQSRIPWELVFCLCLFECVLCYTDCVLCYTDPFVASCDLPGSGLHCRLNQNGDSCGDTGHIATGFAKTPYRQTKSSGRLGSLSRLPCLVLLW
jgi:hypothetical protein